MSENNELNPETFDLLAALDGRSYPTDSVEVYLDEATAFELGRLDKEQQKLTPITPQLRNALPDSVIDLLTVEFIKGLGEKDQSIPEQFEKIQEMKDELRKQIAPSKLTIYIKGFSSEDEKAAQVKALGKYKDPNAAQTIEQQNYYESKIWQLSISKIENASGAVTTSLDEHSITALRNSLPKSEKAKIIEAINALQQQSFNGFELAAQAQDF